MNNSLAPHSPTAEQQRPSKQFLSPMHGSPTPPGVDVGTSPLGAMEAVVDGGMETSTGAWEGGKVISAGKCVEIVLGTDVAGTGISVTDTGAVAGAGVAGVAGATVAAGGARVGSKAGASVAVAGARVMGVAGPAVAVCGARVTRMAGGVVAATGIRVSGMTGAAIGGSVIEKGTVDDNTGAGPGVETTPLSDISTPSGAGHPGSVMIRHSSVTPQMYVEKACTVNPTA